MNIYVLPQHDWWVWKRINVNSLTQRSARTQALNTALYTKSMVYKYGVHLCLRQTIPSHNFTFFFFSLKWMGLAFCLPTKVPAFGYLNLILEFKSLHSSLWTVNLKRQRRKKHGKGSIFPWSRDFLRGDQGEARWSAERVCHCSSSTRQGLSSGVEEFFIHLEET